ncbi:hypothetical protein B0H16DRAFT_1885025 [Mycena metata]|uniref:Uncharacterized protein n=1 Tax=Mycena metata TaxID=1033252 RepID=A0AAD7NES7_9AGAR|nr:hypothetical protein B0H16DRAFT_1885025 [Mycena metata]
MYDAPMDALTQPEPPVAPRYHREERERERDCDREGLGDRDREREQRDRERNQLQMQCNASGVGSANNNCGNASATFAPCSPHPSLAWQGGSPLASAASSAIAITIGASPSTTAAPRRTRSGFGLESRGVLTGPRVFQGQFHFVRPPVRSVAAPSACVFVWA